MVKRYEIVQDLRARVVGKGTETHAIGTEFELHVDVAIVFEAVFECDDVGVRHGLVDLDLGKQLRGE